MKPIVTNERLIESTRLIMAELRDSTGVSACLGVLDAATNEGLVLASLAGNQSLVFKPEVGHRFELHASAPGKIFLAYAPREVSEACRLRGLSPKTPKTICDWPTLADQLTTVRNENVAYDLEECVGGLSCIGTGIFAASRELVGALWITGPTFRFDADSLHALSDTVVAAGLNASYTLSGTGSPRGREHVIDRARAIIHRDPTGLRSMEALASDLGVGYSWFRQTFKQRIGVSPNQYLMTVKLDLAKRMLKESTRSVTDIANELGYETQDYFSAIFKKKVGTSPTRFRKKL